MAKKVSFSSQNLSIDEIVYYKQDLERAIKLYYKSYNEYEKFYTYSIKNINEEKALRLQELELNAIFMLLSSIEALFRIDFNIRVDKKLKDALSQEFRSIYKNKQSRVSLEEDILNVWQNHFVELKVAISEYKGALHYRHWLAHGRYWKPNLARKYDFDSVYILADSIINNLPLKEVA
ncbi:MAG: hypothetical protein RBT59_12675 [Arcobacteraceae bacterium]|jgi:hypothetical protein|nr:hypothetical protein [Arcobacteraceae bacterium]